MTFTYYGETSHPACSEEQGHICQKLSGETCWKDGCEKDAGTEWGPYFCPDHDAERIDRISREMQKIIEDFTPTEKRKIVTETRAEVEGAWTESVSLQCIGITASGSRCRRRTATVTGQAYLCPQHIHQDGVEEGSL